MATPPARSLAEALTAASGRAGTPRRRGMGGLWAGVLSELPLFAGLSKRNVRRVANLAEEARFNPGGVIVERGRPGDAFYVLIDGAARVEAPGRDRVMLGPGDFFGELALLDGGPRTARVVADGEVLALRLPRAAFQRTLRDEPAIALAILQELARRLREQVDPARA
jgi:CRP-like cAMP-binding protein